MLAAFRWDDGLCRLEFRPYRYRDYPKLLEELSGSVERPNLMRDGALKTVWTWKHFEELADHAEYGIVAFLAFTNLVPVLPTTRNWMAFGHQCAGHICRKKVFIGTVLEPKPAIKSAFIRIAEANFYACGGYFTGPRSDPAVTEGYVSCLEGLGLTCGAQAREELCEGIYPVDAVPSTMNICFEGVGDLISLTKDERANPTILFLSGNSD